MTAAASIRKLINELPEGESFSSGKFRVLATTVNIRQILNRLVKTGLIKRLTRNIYVKPKKSELLGELFPNAFEIAKSLSQSTGEIITIQGAEAARMLHLTTQVPMKLIFYTSGNTRTLLFRKTTVTLKHVNPSKLIAAGTIPGIVICALNFIGQQNTTIDTIKKIESLISSTEFSQTLTFINQMPAWMADVFYLFKKETTHEK